MRIVIFSSHYIPYMGGVENYTEHLSKMLIKDGHEVVLVTTLEMGLPEYEVTQEGMRIYRLPSYLLLKGRYPVLKRLHPNTRKVMKTLSKEHFDLCLINTRFYVHTLQGLRFGKDNNIKTIVLEHGTSHLSVHIKPVDFVGSLYEHNFTNRGKRFKAEYYGVSEAANEWLKHFGIKSSGVLYNAIDIEEVEELKKKQVEDYRKKYNIPDDAMLITFTGRMIEEKGVPQLIEAAEHILEERKDVYFFLAGNGKLLDEAMKRTRDNNNINCLGRIDASHIIALLNQSDVFCLPSFSEGFSTSILEAAACKAYIITTYRGGSRELVSSPRYGNIIPDNRLEYVEDALKKAIENPRDCKLAAEDCYTRLIENFTWRQTADAVERIMSEK